MRFFCDFVRVAAPNKTGHLYSMVIDTGAKITVIPKVVALAEGLKVLRRARPPSPGGLISGSVCRAEIELIGANEVFNIVTIRGWTKT